MKDTLKINSSELQKNFPSIYKDFFNAHDTVLSGNSILTWWPDISHGISPLRIKQKLPTKTFCWVNTNTSGKISFGEVVYYSSMEDTFQKDDFSAFFKYDSEKIKDFLKNFLKEHGFSGGLEIDFLTEAPRWHGFSFSWVVSVLLSYTLYSVTGKLDKEVLKDRELAVESPLFKEIYELSLYLSRCISHGKNIGASNNYTVMTPDTSLPVVHISETCVTHNISDTCSLKSNQDGKKCSLIDTEIYKDTLIHFLWIEDIFLQELPLDYGVIFTGMEYRFDEIESTRERMKKKHEHLNVFISRIIQTLPVKENEKITAMNLLTPETDEDAYKNINNTGLQILEWFDYLLRNAHEDSAVDTFIDVVKNTGLVSFSYQKENKLFLTFQYLFYQYRQFEDEEIGVFPFNTGKIGGSLFFVMKTKKSRETVQKVLDHMRSNKYPASLDYASWRDGYSSDSVRIEQCISRKLYSSYTKAGNIIFSDSQGVSYYGDYETIIKSESNSILLDTIQGRIYIRGTKLTSKEIHSQNTTIDMMKLLLENIGQEVSNSKLPVSTYSQNKNELLSKVVIPLLKLSKEYFGKEISLTCSGGITQYYLRLEKDDQIRIGIIKKI